LYNAFYIYWYVQTAFIAWIDTGLRNPYGVGHLLKGHGCWIKIKDSRKNDKDEGMFEKRK